MGNGQYVADYGLKVDDHVNRVAGLRIWFHYKIRKLQLKIDKERENGAELQRLRNELERQREEMERLKQMHQEELASLENKLREITEKLTAEALSEKKQHQVKSSQPDGMLALEERIKTLEESERRLQTENEALREEIKKLRLALEELKFQLEIERERTLEMGQRGEISESEESDDEEGRKEARKKRNKKRKESRKGFTRSIFLRLYEDARNRLIRLAELQKRVRAATMHELLIVLRGIEKAIDLFPIECLENVDKICEHVLLHLSGKEGARVASPYKQRSDSRPTTAGMGSRPTTAGVCSRPVTPMVRRCFSAKWDTRQEIPMILGSRIFSAKR